MSILDDDLYQRCISLAMRSRSGSERYGSLVIRDGEILGEGYNRAIAHPSFGRLERILRMGYANHAEVEAMDAALRAGHPLEGADVYVGGYFVETGALYVKSRAHFSCTRCVPFFERYGIRQVVVPTPRGWEGMTLGEAAETARGFLGDTYGRRAATVDAESHRYSLEDILRNFK